jgi:hypothetical protein
MQISEIDHRCYAIRRLNPFRGVIQIIQIDACRAISIDAERWEIQIRAKQPDDLWGGESAGEPVYRYIRFGTWSPGKGLNKVPAHPFLDLSQMFRKADQIIALLESEQSNLPFPLQDRFELWLLDGDQRLPLALLHSAVSIEETTLYNGHKWVAAEPTSSDFPSPVADQEHPPHPKDTNPHPHLSALTNIIRDNAGHALAQWFVRAADGSGTGMALPGFEQLSNRTLPAEQFPELLIRTHRNNRYETALTHDYLKWQAPLLLTLQGLSDQTRRELEQHAISQALQIDALWRLYPNTVDREFISRARVEARIRTATAG